MHANINCLKGFALSLGEQEAVLACGQTLLEKAPKSEFPVLFGPIGDHRYWVYLNGHITVKD